MIKAVIFDADGPLYYRVNAVAEEKKALLKELGFKGHINVFEKVYEQEKFKGYVRSEHVVQMFWNILDTIGVDNMTQAKAQEFTTKFNDIQSKVTPTSDAISTLTALKAQNIKTCVLTDSFYSEEEKWPWFEAMGMRHLLDYMVSSYDIRQLKDTKEAYDACLEKLGVKADEAIFVGHQPYEMEGAKKAHIASVAVLPIAPIDIEADHTIQSLSELPHLIAQLNKVVSS